jgi:PadR family transcriptional regulator, regulatory protein PadR
MTLPTSSDVLRGTLDLLILKTLALEPMHGWRISERIQQISQDALRVGQGSLYPALQRMDNRGWVTSEWKTSADGRRTKVYALTAEGRRALADELESWRSYVGAVELILST